MDVHLHVNLILITFTTTLRSCMDVLTLGSWIVLDCLAELGTEARTGHYTAPHLLVNLTSQWHHINWTSFVLQCHSRSCQFSDRFYKISSNNQPTSAPVLRVLSGSFAIIASCRIRQSLSSVIRLSPFYVNTCIVS